MELEIKAEAGESKPMRSLARSQPHARTHGVYIRAGIYTGRAGGIRSAYERIGGNGVSELAAS